ncbi:MAG: tRNA (guanosine(46)-N7)-methyltransferase TrmB, partial [bacterium]
KNEHPITLELACGKGEYTVCLVQKFPQRNFIGVDIKGARLWKGAKAALEQNLKNVAFLRIRIEEVTDFFTKNEVDEIWITFPDPYPKKSKANKRLSSPRFLNLYREILRTDGLIHLKTDDADLFNYTLETINAERCIIHEKIEDLNNHSTNDELLGIKTTYEQKYLEAGRTIRYLSFSLNN